MKMQKPSAQACAEGRFFIKVLFPSKEAYFLPLAASSLARLRTCHAAKIVGAMH